MRDHPDTTADLTLNTTTGDITYGPTVLGRVRPGESTRAAFRRALTAHRADRAQFTHWSEATHPDRWADRH